jgi:Ca2+-binding RTX toxin-like protein
MSTTPVVGSTNSDTIAAPNGAGGSYKYDGKAGNDVLKASTGNDILVGGQGSDFLFGGQGSDNFQFSKAAYAGDHDYIVDFQMGVDTLSIFNGASIKAANYFMDGATTMNGQGLANDSKVFDVLLTLHVEDGAKSFDYQVTLLDVVKNTTWSASQVNDYLHTLGFTGTMQYGAPAGSASDGSI